RWCRAARRSSSTRSRRRPVPDPPGAADFSTSEEPGCCGARAGAMRARVHRMDRELAMRCPLYQIDAFTSRRFGGNPAAVVLLDDWLPDDVLAAIAAENNLSETAFVIPAADVCPLRWFTPTVEVDLCGHATLAAAFVLLRERCA